MESRSEPQNILSSLKGNYLERVTNKKINIAQIENQLTKQFSKNSPEQSYQICSIFSPSSKSMNRKNIESPFQQDTKNTVSGLFYILKNGLDVIKSDVPSLKLVNCDVDVYFDTLFNNYAVTTFSGPGNTKKALDDSVGVVIFSNDSNEIAKICNEIEVLSGAKPSPFIFVATTTKKLDISFVDANIAEVITCANIDSREIALSFWQIIRDRLDLLSEMSAKLNPKKELECKIM